MSEHKYQVEQRAYPWEYRDDSGYEDDGLPTRSNHPECRAPGQVTDRRKGERRVTVWEGGFPHPRRDAGGMSYNTTLEGRTGKDRRQSKPAPSVSREGVEEIRERHKQIPNPDDPLKDSYRKWQDWHDIDRLLSALDAAEAENARLREALDMIGRIARTPPQSTADASIATITETALKEPR